MNTYDPEQWHDLFEMIGASAGALVGLLFVVVTLHFDRITERADDNLRITMQGARYNMLHLLTVLVESAVVLAPQPLVFAGGELITINLFGLRLPFNIILRYVNKNITISNRGGFPTMLLATIIFAYLLGAGGGALMFHRPEWALYLVTASCLIKLVRSVLTAWMLLFGVTQAKLK
ncbi:MAG TPA: hypothetical protein VG891_04990 [Rhizomicrobium sp.]|nr:hypothetical protein [Rhizomicrobium sp.]